MSLTATIIRGAAAPLDLPAGDTEPRTPWIDRWTFERGGKRWRVVVVPVRTRRLNPIQEAYEFDHREAPVDAREWVEALVDRERWPEGTEFEVRVEEVTS